jgi:hypothetical protein
MCTDFGHPHRDLRGTPIRWLQTGVYIYISRAISRPTYLLILTSDNALPQDSRA